ncbi:C2 calcium-dependent domain-containing protein 4C-like [Centroberyx affinis]|uniref:C2 calcium-dependent domain-containing protein 4C-like n=1 Tax=Centroberyx affinis TaxID=166261 RepID=UPI003A5C13A1
MWVSERIRVSVDPNHFAFPVEYSFRLADVMFGEKASRDRRKKASLCPNVITPSSIPEFRIPPKIPTQQEPRSPDRSERLAAAKGTRSEGGGPEGEASGEPLAQGIRAETADERPHGGFGEDRNTNADPQSQAALSLPHLAKTQTCYGFCTLLESPHTRRKESLFHGDPGSRGLPPAPPRSRAPGASSGPPRRASSGLRRLASRLRPPRDAAPRRRGTPDSDASSSSSPFDSPSPARPPPDSSSLKAPSHQRLPSRTARRATASRSDSPSTDEGGSSTDDSPAVLRRASGGSDPPPGTSGLAPPGLAPPGLAPPAVFPADPAPSRDGAAKESLVPVGREGALRLSAEYRPEDRRLRVRLIGAEGLYAGPDHPKTVGCSVSVCLLPGKSQKQHSSAVRRSRDPVFNHDFFFHGVGEEDVENRSLRFKVVNKMPTMKRDHVLGDCEILLNSVLTV